MEENKRICFCPIEGVIDVISKKWSLLIVNTLGNFQVLRFNELEERLKGISPKGISDALLRLQGIGLVERRVYNEVPPRVEYWLTRDGGQFREAVVPLIRWVANREDWDSKCCPVTCERHDGGEGCQHHVE